MSKILILIGILLIGATGAAQAREYQKDGVVDAKEPWGPYGHDPYGPPRCVYPIVSQEINSSSFPLVQVYDSIKGSNESSSVEFKVTQSGQHKYVVDVRPKSETVSHYSQCPAKTIRIVVK